MNDEVRASSADLHNQNCFSYLKKLNLPTTREIDELRVKHDRLGKALAKIKSLEANVSYIDLYRELMESLEEVTPLPDVLDDLILSIYENDNGILEHAFNTIRPVLEANHVGGDLEHNIADHLKDSSGADGPVHTSSTPAEAGSRSGRFRAMVSSEFKPQHTTSLVTVRKYGYQDKTMPTEYRIGTQGQRHEGEARVSPLFERYLEIKAQRQLNANPQEAINIEHIYFNNLGLDRTDYEGKKERAMSLRLQALADNHPNIAVITVPSDKGFMDKHEHEHQTPEHNYHETFDAFLDIAMEMKRPGMEVQDFYISPKVRALLFDSSDPNKKSLKMLIRESFEALGLKGKKLSSAERQAVFFHFTKFVLPNYIIETLKPQGINFTCKDAIDRGGVSSAYFNLIKSFGTEKPLSREEFERGLHAAPAMVKARGMNHHIKLIWNTVDSYIKAKGDEIAKDENKDWLIGWRDDNCPKKRVGALLSERLEEHLQTLLEMEHKSEAIRSGVVLLCTMQDTQSSLSPEEKKIVLRVARLTVKLCEKPNDEAALAAYDGLIKEMKAPKLGVFTRLMRMFRNLISPNPSAEDTVSQEMQTMKGQLDKLRMQGPTNAKDDAPDETEGESTSFHN